MYRRTIETSTSPHITVEECRGNLTVRAGAENEVMLLVQAEEDEVGVQREGETLSLVLPETATLTCPPMTSLTIGEALGNLHVEGIEGPVTAQSVHGNATLRALGPVAFQETLGNLTARDLKANLEGQDVKGNARVQGVADKLTLQEVSGNLTAEGLGGGLSVEKVRGNARLRPPFTAGASYRLDVGGNLTVFVPQDASLHVALKSGAHVSSQVAGLQLEKTNRRVEGTLGAGEAKLEAEVGANVSLRPADAEDAFEVGADLEGLSAQIEWQVNEAVAQMTSRLEESLGRVDSAAIRERVDRATEHARRQAERAAERARMRAERAERRWRRVSGHPSRPEQKAASDEERLRVLRMVEEGRLTPEQASELLAALEGE